MPGSFAYLRPFDLLVEVAGLTNLAIEAGMRRDLFKVSCRPAPNDPDPILDMLLMASVAIDLFVRALLPGLPSCLHDMAGAAEAGIIFDIIIKTVAA